MESLNYFFARVGQMNIFATTVNKERYFSIVNLLTSGFKDGRVVLREIALLKRHIDPGEKRFDRIVERIARFVEPRCIGRKFSYATGVMHTRGEPLRPGVMPIGVGGLELVYFDFELINNESVVYQCLDGKFESEENVNIDRAVEHYRSYLVHALLLNFSWQERVYYNLFVRDMGLPVLLAAAIMVGLSVTINSICLSFGGVCNVMDVRHSPFGDAPDLVVEKHWTFEFIQCFIALVGILLTMSFVTLVHAVKNLNSSF